LEYYLLARAGVDESDMIGGQCLTLDPHHISSLTIDGIAHHGMTHHKRMKPYLMSSARMEDEFAIRYASARKQYLVIADSLLRIGSAYGIDCHLLSVILCSSYTAS